MPYRFVLTLCAALLAVPIDAQALPIDDVPLEQKAALAEAIKLRNGNDQDGALAKFKLLRTTVPNSFTINFEYGRLLAQMKRYHEASEVLDMAIKLMDRVDTKYLTIYNTKGFVLLMLNDFERALDFFLMEINSSQFGIKSDSLRMKVHNNAGLACLQLDRYVEAQKHFLIAKELGSKLAEKNIEIISSILETARASNEDLPGIFTTAVGSVKNSSQATVRMNELALKLKVPSSNLLLFKQSNGIYQITLGSNYSYRKAERLVKEARAKGVEDAFVASTTDWTLESTGVINNSALSR